MIIKSIHVRNFRSILDESLPCDRLTALVGRNGAGKSSFLRALELFYDPAARVTLEDFYAEDTSQDIGIAITFTELGREGERFFSAYIDKGDLTVARVFSLLPGRKSGTYHGMRLQNPDFVNTRNAGGKREIVASYNELRATEAYSSLPPVRSADQAFDALERWEHENPISCTRLRDDGQFFGFMQVGQGYLGRHTRFMRIPAVRDAQEDAIEGKGSCVTEMMDLVVRSVLARRRDVTSFKEETQVKYREIMDPAKLTDLVNLQSQLSGTLRHYTPDASVSLRWVDLADISIPMPQAQVKLLEDGYESTVQRTGHGLQRAFILTMLQHLVAARELQHAAEEGYRAEVGASKPDEPHLPSLVLAIEEPELYQHPSRQRHMASVLLKLAVGAIPGVARSTQVIYTTHEPLFVGLDRFDQVRLLRKVTEEAGRPKVTKVCKGPLSDVAEVLWKLDGQQGDKFTAESLRPRLQAIMTPWMNEGFFADVVVLVEGEGDRAAILAAAEALGHDLESMGICVVPCMSKNNLDRPAVIFRQFGIRTYLVWDNDKDAKEPKPEDNKRLLRLVGAPEEDWPIGVWDTHACHDCNLERTLREELTPVVFDELLAQAQVEFRMARDQARKNPFVSRYILKEASRKQHASTSLNATVEAILELRRMELE